MRIIKNTTQTVFFNTFSGPSKGHRAASGDPKMSLCPLARRELLARGDAHVFVFKTMVGFPNHAEIAASLLIAVISNKQLDGTCWCLQSSVKGGASRGLPGAFCTAKGRLLRWASSAAQHPGCFPHQPCPPLRPPRFCKLPITPPHFSRGAQTISPKLHQILHEPVTPSPPSCLRNPEDNSMGQSSRRGADSQSDYCWAR